MQRLFSMFPGGLVGATLLILRSAVATTVLLNALHYRTLGLSLWHVVGLCLGSLFLISGLLTPYMSVATILLLLCSFRSLDQRVFQYLTSLIGLGVIAILGPGAYSIDARIFGRRLLELPPNKPR